MIAKSVQKCCQINIFFQLLILIPLFQNYLEFCWSLVCLVTSLNVVWPVGQWELEFDGSRLQTGTAWSVLSRPGDLRWTPRSRWDPRSQGWTRTSSVVILSLGSFLSRHLIRHLARELRLSGKVNCPLLILANKPLCSAPWKGYLQPKHNYKSDSTKIFRYILPSHQHGVEHHPQAPHVRWPARVLGVGPENLRRHVGRTPVLVR